MTKQRKNYIFGSINIPGKGLVYLIPEQFTEEELFYIKKEEKEGRKVLVLESVSREDLQECFYDNVFSDVDFMKEVGLTPDLFKENFKLEGGQLDEIEKVFLYNFVQKIKPKKIIEFSPSNGHSTTIISKAIEDKVGGCGFFETYEINPNCIKNTELLLYDHDIDFVSVHFGDVFGEMDKEKLKEADFVFIDSDHGEEFARKYIKEFFPLLKKGCWVVIHDIRFHKNYINGESRAIRDYFDENKINSYFHIADVMKYFSIANDFKPCAKNTMLFYRV